MKIDQFIPLGLKTCVENPLSKKHCSIICRGNKIISVGINKHKTHPLAAKYGYRYNELHSELDAFRKTDERSKLTLINFRYNRYGQMRMSKPCVKCLPWCLEIFDNIYYTTREGIVLLS